MERNALSRPTSPYAMARSYSLPVVTVLAAIGIFAFDTITDLEVAVSVLYVAVVLMAARFLESRYVIVVALGCVALALISHFVTRHESFSETALLNLLIGLGAIGIATYLALLSQPTQTALQRQADLLDVTHDTIFVRDMNDVITYWNRGAEELYGWKSKDAVGKVTHQLMQTAFPQPLEQITATLLSTGRWEGEIVHTKHDGTRAHVASRWSLQRYGHGQPVATLETNNDITERKRVEAQLRESERRYRHIFETITVSIWEEDFSQVKAAIDDLKAQGVEDFPRHLAQHPGFVQQAVAMVKVLDVNDASVKLFEAKDKGELLASLAKVFTSETYEAFQGELIAIYEGRNSFESEAVLQTLSGRKLSVLFSTAFSCEQERLDRVLVTIMDVTAMRQAEQALQQARVELAHVNRVTTLGELAASIAHEVNQPLAGVVSNSDAALRWLSAQSPDLREVQEALQGIAADGVRASEIISRIRALVKKVPPRKEVLNINDVVTEVVALTRNEVQRNCVNLQTSLASNLPGIFGDRIQLQQVLVNLILNAVEMMAEMAEGKRHLLVGTGRASEDDVLVMVRDSGPGLNPETADQLFRAFYTSKPGGMGMGLSICRSIVEAHEGRIWATNNADAGATFQFSLRSVARAAA